MGLMASIGCEIRDHTGLRFIALLRENIPDIDGTQGGNHLSDFYHRKKSLLTEKLAPVIRIGY
jgi:hypothetical protein